MRAGQLRHRVTIQRIVLTRATDGGAPGTPVTVSEVWANVEPLSGKEYFQASQRQMELTHQVTLRYDPNLLLRPTMQVVFEGRVFDIQVIRHVNERHREVQLMCRELVNG